MCGIISVIDRKKNPMDGSAVREALTIMNERGGMAKGGQGMPSTAHSRNLRITMPSTYFMTTSSGRKRPLKQNWKNWAP